MTNLEKLKNWKYRNEEKTVTVIHKLKKLGGRRYFDKKGDFKPQQEYVIAQIPVRVSPNGSKRENSFSEYEHKVNCIHCVQEHGFVPKITVISNWEEYVVITPDLLKKDDIFKAATKYEGRRAIENGLWVGFFIALILSIISSVFSLFDYVSLGFLENYIALFFILFAAISGIFFLILRPRYMKNTTLMRDKKGEDKLYLYRRKYLKNCDLSSCENLQILSSASIQYDSDTISDMHDFIGEDEKGEERMMESLSFKAREELDKATDGLFDKIYY